MFSVSEIHHRFFCFALKTKNRSLLINLYLRKYKTNFMHSRRKFVKQTTLAATAMIAAGPFEVLAKASDTFNSTGANNRIIIFHTTGLNDSQHQQTIHFVRAEKKKTPGSILINIEEGKKDQTGLKYDLNLTPGKYQVLLVGKIRAGVIHIDKRETGIISSTNRLASYLKKEKKCRVVICLSDLGFKQVAYADDLNLAKNSDSIDIIIGVNKENLHQHSFIARNKNKADVILQYTQGNPSSFGKIEILFNDAGEKINISLLNKIPNKKGRDVAA